MIYLYKREQLLNRKTHRIVRTDIISLEHVLADMTLRVSLEFPLLVNYVT